MVHSRRKRPAGKRSHARLLTAALLVLGVAWMHALAAAPIPAAVHAGAIMATQATPRCASDGDHDPCPDSQHDGGHATAMCQSGLPPAIGTPTPTFTVSQAAVPATPARALTGTVAADAADGTGCGPPQRSELSIWRT
ncbi:DUF6153 family protein [Dactylosporangium sp. NBC_01737]|uniref:DUF6153 family protein n=1 Tax=Dactylosporangium sp. NBC_01737 TaxID=2975959 RepID=UPI002E0E9ABE|nr:DUF6153 family protein [Dactylosporangium sp. NBC_01737]